MSRKTTVGGQAVIEGVMMRGMKGIATAVRKPNGEIVVDRKESIPFTKRNKVLGLPIIRGFISLIESLIVGISTLNYSASFFEDEEEGEPSRFDKWFKGIFKDKTDDVVMGITLCISIGIATLLFFILPTFAANIFKKVGIYNSVGLNIIEGVIRVIIFLVYIFLIGKMDDIKRVFQYHGAEHKTIFCYENEIELTPENVEKFNRFHPRCGTNFLFLVMIVSIILFSLTGWSNIWERIMYRIILLPIVSGITYEIIKWMGKSESVLSKVTAYPGLMLQKLTTKEPDYKQIEVAIAALKSAEGIVD
jgi:Predicted metal-dependent enzyme